jgi:hypothetical protein
MAGGVLHFRARALPAVVGADISTRPAAVNTAKEQRGHVCAAPCGLQHLCSSKLRRIASRPLKSLF